MQLRAPTVTPRKERPEEYANIDLHVHGKRITTQPGGQLIRADAGNAVVISCVSARMRVSSSLYSSYVWCSVEAHTRLWRITATNWQSVKLEYLIGY